MELFPSLIITLIIRDNYANLLKCDEYEVHWHGIIINPISGLKI